MADIDKIAVNNTTYNIKDSTARDSIYLASIENVYTVNGGYFNVDLPNNNYNTFIVQPFYKSGIIVTPYFFTVQKASSKVTVYVRNPDGSRPADGTTLCCSILAVK